MQSTKEEFKLVLAVAESLSFISDAIYQRGI